MSSASAFDPQSARVVAIEADSEDDTLDWEEWLAALEDDEPVHLPRPAAEYLHEARSAGEV